MPTKHLLRQHLVRIGPIYFATGPSDSHKERPTILRRQRTVHISNGCDLYRSREGTMLTKSNVKHERARSCCPKLAAPRRRLTHFQHFPVCTLKVRPTSFPGPTRFRNTMCPVAQFDPPLVPALCGRLRSHSKVGKGLKSTPAYVQHSSLH